MSEELDKIAIECQLENDPKQFVIYFMDKNNEEVFPSESLEINWDDQETEEVNLSNAQDQIHNFVTTRNLASYGVHIAYQISGLGFIPGHPNE